MTEFTRTFTAKVVGVVEKTRAMSAVKVGERTDEHGNKFPVWDVPRESLGWFVTLEGSHESLYVGRDCPDLVVGDVVEVTLRKASWPGR